jgi:hypothetical protein
MTETAENAATTETKSKKGKAPKKPTKTTAAASKAKPARAAKPKREKPPRESREGWGTFALKMPVPERDAFHKAAGPASASRFARAVLVAFANDDESAFKNAMNEAKKLR